MFLIFLRVGISSETNTDPEPSVEVVAEESVTQEPAAEEPTASADEEVYIPDPVLKKVIQDTLGIGDREILASDAMKLTEHGITL